MKIADLVTDTPLRLKIEERAREDAGAGQYNPPAIDFDGTYQQQLMQSALEHVYVLAHGKRLARIQRMKESRL